MSPLYPAVKSNLRTALSNPLRCPRTPALWAFRSRQAGAMMGLKPLLCHIGLQTGQHRVLRGGRCTDATRPVGRAQTATQRETVAFTVLGCSRQRKRRLLALTDQWISLVLLNRSSPSCRHLPCGGGIYLFPFVLFMYFPSISWGGGLPGDGERRRFQNVIRVAGLSDTAVWSILVSLDPPNESTLFQHSDSFSRRIGRTSTARCNGFHGRPAVSLLACAAHQKAVHCELDGCQVITE